MSSNNPIRDRYVTKMTSELGETFHLLWEDCARLHLKWEHFVVLYGTSVERIQLLNEASPDFFHFLQGSIWESVLLNLCRLTDPEVVAGRKTLTLMSLPRLVRSDLKLGITASVIQAQKACEFARDWRNRRITHNDLLLKKGSAMPLRNASRRNVREALHLIRESLNLVESTYCESTTAYEHSVGFGGTLQLLYLLRDGLRYEEERETRLRSGTSTKKDLSHDPL